MSNPSSSGVGSGSSTPAFSLFGQSSSAAQTSGNLFGSTVASASGSVFGQNSNPAPKFGSAFGSTATPASGGVFGTTTGQNASGASMPLFGGGAGSKPAFGTNTSSSNAFSSTGQGSTTFGGGSTTNGPSLFGSKVDEKKPSLLSASPFNIATPSKSATAKPAFSFGGPSTTPGGPPPTDAPTTTNSVSSLFNIPTAQPATSQATAQSPSTTPAAPPQSGAQTNLFSLGGQPKPAFSFGPATSVTASAPSTTATSTSSSQAPSLFGTTNTATAPASNLFASFAQKKETPLATTGNTTAPAIAVTSTTTAAAPSAAAPTASAPSLFGASTAQTATTQAAGQAPPVSTVAPPSSGTTVNPTASGTASSLFNVPAVQPSTTTNVLGSSTAGPAPSAQSRLKNKSMDEIITRWASDLAKYQKEFQSQAERVSSWDRMLVENGNAISKLYSRTFQAERDTAELQRQLSAVEGHQDELSQWLDRYEREIDEMLARQVGQHDGMQGPDQERERTYKTAEKVSDRLNEMGQSLTGMIDEINSTSSSIQKSSKPDDPLSQIVRILNGHLSQLQAIDQGTSALQSKVATAQKESQRLGHRGHRGSGNDAVDDFYRSYSRRA